MAERPVGVTDQTSGAGIADVRTRERSVGGNTVAEQYVIPISERVAGYKGMVGTFRTPGRAATTQNLFSVFNADATGLLVAVRRLTIQMDNAAVLNTSWANLFTVSRITTAPTNGTTLTPVDFDTGLTHDTDVTFKGDSSADGTSSGTTLTSTPTGAGWRQFANRIHTAVGQIIMDDESMIPVLCMDDPIILRQNQGLLVSLQANATAANGTTVMYIVNCMAEEFTLP